MKPIRWSGLRAPVLLVLACAGVDGRGQAFTGFVGWESRNAGFAAPEGTELDFNGTALVDMQTSPARNWATLRAEAGPGLLRSSVDVGLGGLLPGEGLTASPDGGVLRSVAGRSFAEFADTLTVTLSQPGLSPVEGKVRFRVVVDGGMGAMVASHTGRAESRWLLEGSRAFVVDPVRGERYMPTPDNPGLLDQDLFDGDGYAYSNATGGGQVESGMAFSDSEGSTIVFDLPVYFGSSFDIGLGLRTEASVSLVPRQGYEDTAVGSAYAFADYGNTARLSVQGVFDAAGVPLGVGEYQFTSASGHGYGMAAVPEPREWALVTGGLLPLGWWLRRRRKGVGVGGRQSPIPCRVPSWQRRVS